MASSEQFQTILGGHIEFDQPVPDTIHQPQVPLPPLVFPVCCHRIGGPPDFVPMEDRRMEWSPIHPSSSGSSSSWTYQWLCLSCSRTFRVEDVPPLPEASCPECQRNSGAVLDVTTGDVRRVCTFCDRVVSVPDPPVLSPDWFSSGPLCQLSPLYGWDSPVPAWRRHPVVVVLSTHLFGSVGCGNPICRSPVLHWSPGSSPGGADSVLDTPCARHHCCVCCPFLFHLP